MRFRACVLVKIADVTVSASGAKTFLDVIRTHQLRDCSKALWHIFIYADMLPSAVPASILTYMDDRRF